MTLSTVYDWSFSTRYKRFTANPLSWILLMATLTTPANAIVGGTNDLIGTSSTVMVLHSAGGLCTGIVIAQNVVLTSAHCIPKGLDVRVHYRNEAGAPILIPISEVVQHPAYQKDAIRTRSRSIDLGLIKLPEPLPESFTASPLYAGEVAENASLSIDGYGATIEGNTRSTGILNRAELVEIKPFGPSKLILWATDKNRLGKQSGSGACHGDSGGPIRFNENVIAVTAWSTGVKNAQCGLLTQAIRLAPHRDWIDITLSKWAVRAKWAAHTD